jgi:NAD+ synthase (glutamine-hydrolysing)
LFLGWAAVQYKYPTLQSVLDATPTAELRPIVASDGGAAGDGGGESKGESTEHSQTDEDDMGMSYEELGWFGRLRKIQRHGPVSMFRRLLHVWHSLTPGAIAAKVKRFFFYYAVNRHKMTTITPSYHAEAYVWGGKGGGKREEKRKNRWEEREGRERGRDRQTDR